MDDHVAFFQENDDKIQLIGQYLCFRLRWLLKSLPCKSFAQQYAVFFVFKNEKLALVSGYLYRGAFVPAELICTAGEVVIPVVVPDSSFA